METQVLPYKLNTVQTKDMLLHAFRFIATYPELHNQNSWADKNGRCIGGWILEFNGMHIMHHEEFDKAYPRDSYWDYICENDPHNLLKEFLDFGDMKLHDTDPITIITLFDGTLQQIAESLFVLYGNDFVEYVRTWL